MWGYWKVASCHLPRRRPDRSYAIGEVAEKSARCQLDKPSIFLVTATSENIPLVFLRLAASLPARSRAHVINPRRKSDCHEALVYSSDSLERKLAERTHFSAQLIEKQELHGIQSKPKNEPERTGHCGSFPLRGVAASIRFGGRACWAREWQSGSGTTGVIESTRNDRRGRLSDSGRREWSLTRTRT